MITIWDQVKALSPDGPFVLLAAIVLPYVLASMLSKRLPLWPVLASGCFTLAALIAARHFEIALHAQYMIVLAILVLGFVYAFPKPDRGTTRRPRP